LLQAAYGNYQIGAFENFHQLVEYTLIVLRPGPKVFFQYELRFVDRLKSQLLISHLFFPSKKYRPAGKKEQEIKPPFGRYPRFFGLSDQFLFQWGGAQRPNRGISWFHTASEVPWRLRMAARLSRLGGGCNRTVHNPFRKIRLSFRR
jgi:hypothetical protein